MKQFRRCITFVTGIAALAAAGCSDSGSSSSAITAGKFTILDTRTDRADRAKAKQNAENTLVKFPDVDAMVGLWAYNIPQCLEALKDAERVGEVKLFSFDEDEVTLQGIINGHIEGTIVQQPYEYGYQSVKYLKDVIEGKEIELPENKEIDIPTKTITKANVEAFWENLKSLRKIGEEAEKSPRPDSPIQVAFVINNPDPFWTYARAGCFKAEQDFGIRCDFEAPDGTTTEQNRIMENILLKGDYQGVAISPLDPANQTAVINKVAEKMPLICHDSDAPGSKRLFYLGANNYKAGRMLGKLIKERMPEGGKLMVFVGNMDVLNAQQRRQGLIDELKAE